MVTLVCEFFLNLRSIFSILTQRIEQCYNFLTRVSSFPWDGGEKPYKMLPTTQDLINHLEKKPSPKHLDNVTDQAVVGWCSYCLKRNCVLCFPP